MTDREHRKFPRLQAAILWRRANAGAASPGRAADISLGGARLFADDPHSPGQHLDLEVFMPDGAAIKCQVEVVWAEPLPIGSPARFEIGVKFSRLGAADQARIATLLEKK